jgi:hypothetical protein
MNSRWLTIGITLLLTGCLNPIASATRAAKPLTYVGFISAGTPGVKRNQIVVPLQYSGGEWAMNSGLIPHQVDVRVVERTIEFTVLVSVPGARANDAGYELRLPAALKGEYQLVYRDPDGALHPLRTIEL